MAESGSGSGIEVTMERDYATSREAEELRLALEPDRPSYLDTSRDGSTLRFHVRGTSAASVRATLDDLLAALTAAERTRGIGSPSRQGRGRAPAPREGTG
ncbi:MAG: KEOPS complex subunit Pcc1 [Thermoplasmata archaeon]